MTATPVETLLAKLDDVRPSGRGFEARCPAHDDQRRSLTVNEGDDGKALITCHAGAGCDPKAIVGALGLTMADLFPPREGAVRSSGAGRRVVASYSYRDAAGRLVYEVERLDPKSFRQRRPDGHGGWEWNLDGTPRLLYRWPELIAADPDATVFVVEGEKDADALAAMGLVATCNSGGAGKWRAGFADAFRGRRVAVLADNDDAGRAHAEAVARSLAGVAAAVAIVELPGLPPKGDVSDWLAAGGTADELRRRVGAASVWTPTRPLNPLNSNNTGPDPYSGDSKDSGDASRPWDAPAALTEGERPPFPTEALPTWLRAFVDAESVALQVPAALPALLGLACVATAAAGKVTVAVREGWSEPVNIFAAVALPPANRKSQAFADATAPIVAYEVAAAAAAAAEIAQAETRRKIAEASLAKAQTDAARATAAGRADAILGAEAEARELAALAQPVMPRLIVDDCSPEKVAVHLAEQSERLAIMAPEGDVFELMAGRYSANGMPNLGAYLRGHAGDTIRVDRIGRPPLFVRRPALTVCLTVQPAVIAGLAARPDFRGRGLLARFLYAVPDSLVGRRDPNPAPVPDAVRLAYADRLGALLDLPLPSAAADGDATPRRLRLGPAASALFDAFLADLEPRLGEFGDLGHIADWGGKLGGAVARLAGLLHLAGHAGDGAPWDAAITPETLDAALHVADAFLVPHAVAAFAEMGADPAIADARYVLRWIERRGRSDFTRRDLYQDAKRRFRRAEDLDRPLDLLTQHGYLRPRPGEERGGPGRKPSPTFDVNPLGRPQNPHCPQNGAAGSYSGDSQDSGDGSAGDKERVA